MADEDLAHARQLLTVAENPFCARRLHPRAASFCFREDCSAGQLVEKLRGAGWWGQIVGAHGSGKSTLLATLAGTIERNGLNVLSIELHDGQRRLPPEVRAALPTLSEAVVVVDGYEQLGHWERLWLKRRCRKRGLGLLVTSHECVGLPDLFHTAVDSSLAWQVVARLLEGYPSLIAEDDVARTFAARGGDLRETLFDLYDLFEERRGR